MFLQWCYLFYYVTSEVSDSIWLQFLKLIMIIARKGHWIWRLNIVRPLAAFISWKFMNRGIQPICVCLFTTSFLCTQKVTTVYIRFIRVSQNLRNLEKLYHFLTFTSFFRFKKFLITKNSVILSSYWIFCGVNLLAKKAKIRKSRISGPTI